MQPDVQATGDRIRWGMALVCIAVGAFPIALATGVLTPEPGQLKAPEWVVGACGGVFVLAGIMMLASPYPRVTSFLAGLFCLAFAAVAVWVAGFAPTENFSGGLPLLPHGVNVAIGRGLIGFGALICGAMAWGAFRKAMRSD